MKKYIAKFITAFILVAILPLQVWAAGEDEIRLSTDGGSAPENGRSTFRVTVEASVIGADQEQLSSLQLGLMFTDQDGNQVTSEALLEELGQEGSVSFQWDEGVNAKAKITEYRYQEEAGILRIYIGGTEPLFGKNGELVMGDMVIHMKDSLASGIYVGVVPGSFKKVQGSYSAPILGAKNENLPDPVLLTEKSPDEPDEPVKPDDPVNPGGGSGGGSGSTGGTNRPGADKSTLKNMLEIAAGYQEADYTPESYAVLKQAVKDAQAVLEDENATQEEVDRAAAALMNAIAGLVPVSNAGVGDGNGQNTPSAGGNSGQNPGQVSGSGQEKSVRTGDEAMAAVWIYAAAFSAAAFAAGKIRRKRKGH